MAGALIVAGSTDGHLVTASVPFVVNWVSRLTLGSAFAMATLLPMVLLIQSPRIRGEDEPRRDIARAGISARLPDARTFAGRLADPHPRVLESDGRGQIPRSRWEARTGASHPVVLAHAGYPTIESSPAYRSGNVGLGLNPAPTQSDTLLDLACSETVLDFFSVSATTNFDTPVRCPITSGRFDATVTELRYHNFLVSDKMKSISLPVCALALDCLKSATQSVSSSLRPTWSLCKHECWFTYNVLPNIRADLEWLILPARFDPALRASEVPQWLSLETSEFRGLLAVRVGQRPMSTTVKVTLDPDLRMRAVAMMPYASLVALLLVVVALVHARLASHGQRA